MEHNLSQEGGNEIKEKGTWHEEKEEEKKRETGERNRCTVMLSVTLICNDSGYKKSHLSHGGGTHKGQDDRHNPENHPEMRIFCFVFL